MKTKSIVNLSIYVVVLALLCTLALTGMQVGIVDVLPLGNAIKQGLDLSGGLSILYQAVDPSTENFNTKMDGAMAIMRTRMDQYGYTEATITLQGQNRIRVEIPTMDDSDRETVLKNIGSPAKLEFIEPDGDIVCDGSQIISARAAYGDGNAPIVAFQLNQEATASFAEATKRLRNQRISIVLDGEEISAPTVESQIPNGEGIITNLGSIENARNLAGLIQSGALPLELDRVEVRDISATLGADALRNGLIAGVIGIACVILFMLVIYRLLGIVSALALVTYIYLDILALAVIGVQLTLPGIAGIILSIGMAVDANVIIYERMNEELRSGKTVRASFNASFQRAIVSIVDSNVTTLIAAVVLWIFGTGPIQGFAIVLFIGILLSMLTSITITKMLLRNIININYTNTRLYMKIGTKEVGTLENI